MEWFRACFAELEDPRTGNAQRHELDEIVMIALLATLCGAEGCVDMALFGRSKEPLLRQFSEVAGRGSEPRHLLADLPAARSAGLRGLLCALPCGPVGTGPRRGRARRQDGAPLVRPPAGSRALASDQRLGVRDAPGAGPAAGRRQVERDPGRAGAACPAGGGRLHRHRRRDARPEGHGAGDLDRGGDYVLALKANRPALFEDVRLLLDDPAATADAVASTTDGDHGRIETRRAAIIHDVAWLAEIHGFPGLKAIGKVTATRAQGGQATTASRYYLLSRGVIHGHDQIERRLPREPLVARAVLKQQHARQRPARPLLAVRRASGRLADQAGRLEAELGPGVAELELVLGLQPLVKVLGGSRSSASDIAPEPTRCDRPAPAGPTPGRAAGRSAPRPPPPRSDRAGGGSAGRSSPAPPPPRHSSTPRSATDRSPRRSEPPEPPPAHDLPEFF